MVVDGGSAAVPEEEQVSVRVVCSGQSGSGESYQVATPSLLRMRGSFCLVRLLKVFTPVSNPLGLTQVWPDPAGLQWDLLLDRVRLEFKIPWRSFPLRIMVLHTGEVKTAFRIATTRLVTSHADLPPPFYVITSRRCSAAFSSFPLLFSLFMHLSKAELSKNIYYSKIVNETMSRQVPCS